MLKFDTKKKFKKISGPIKQGLTVLIVSEWLYRGWVVMRGYTTKMPIARAPNDKVLWQVFTNLQKKTVQQNGRTLLLLGSCLS